MVKESPISVIIIFLAIVIAVVGPMTKHDGEGLELKSNLEQCPAAIPIVVLAILVVIGYVIWRRGQPWRR